MSKKNGTVSSHKVEYNKQYVELGTYRWEFKICVLNLYNLKNDKVF